MREGLERLAWEARRAIGLGRDEAPTLEQLERVIAADPTLRLEYDPAARVGVYEPEPGGISVIRLALPATTESLAHELAHHLRGDGLGCFLRVMAQANGDFRLARTAELVRSTEESAAAAFVTALFLPAPLVLSADDYQIAELTGWGIDAIRARRWELARAELRDPERFRRLWFQWLGA